MNRTVTISVVAIGTLFSSKAIAHVGHSSYEHSHIAEFGLVTLSLFIGLAWFHKRRKR